MMEDNNIVTVSEVNKAEEAYERAVDEYEQAKLTLQQVELEFADKMSGISPLKRQDSMNPSMVGSCSQSLCGIASSPVKLIESSKVLGTRNYYQRTD